MSDWAYEWVVEAELTPGHTPGLLAALWIVIEKCDDPVAVNSAIRKYSACMPVENYDKLAPLLLDQRRLQTAICIERHFKTIAPEQEYPELIAALYKCLEAHPAAGFGPEFDEASKLYTAALAAAHALIMLGSTRVWYWLKHQPNWAREWIEDRINE